MRELALQISGIDTVVALSATSGTPVVTPSDAASSGHDAQAPSAPATAR